MAVTASKQDYPSSQFIKVKMGQNDEFVLDFSGSRNWGKSDPNGLTGIRVRTEADTGIGLNAMVAIGKEKAIETLRIGYTATASVFYVDQPFPSSFFQAGRRVYCRNQTENEVRACEYDIASRKITLAEPFTRIVLPTDEIYLDLNEELQNQPKIEAGSTTTILRFNDAGDQYIHANYDIEIPIGTTRHVRRVSSKTTTRIQRAGSANYNASAVDTANNTITVSNAANYRVLESAGSVYVANTGGYSGWAVGDVVELRALPGSANNFRVYTESGTQINFDGSGTPSNVQLRLTTPVIAFTIDRALPSVPANDSNVYVVSGSNSSSSHPLVEVASASTTTQLFFGSATWDSAITASDDVIYKGQHRDISAVSNTDRRITLATALPAAPAPGEEIEIGHSSDDFHEESDLTIASSGTPRAKAITIGYPITGMKFTAVGGASNTDIAVEVAALGLPDVSERV